MKESIVWFSHKENKYDAELKLFQKKYFYWTDKSPTWDWDNCAVTWIKKSEQELHVVIRSSKSVRSDYRGGRTVKVKYMLGFDVRAEDIHYPIKDDYRQPDNKKKKDGPVKSRWAFQLNKHYYIWQWAEEDKNGLENSEIYRIYSEIKKTLTEPITTKKSIFRVPGVPADNRLIPVIYQAAIDSWKNFVREVHCHKVSEDEYEVTILFENEHLRMHSPLDLIYRLYRYLRYGRVTDIESFRIILKEGLPTKFRFEGIYSNEHGIEHDNIHGDIPINGRVPTHNIKYYFNNEKHPIIFINTANHAMSFHDTNHKIWKWEYVPWEEDSAIIYGEKPRNKVDRYLWPK
jgi:hypothetical protein